MTGLQTEWEGEPDRERKAGEGDDRALPWPQVRDLTGVSRATAWRQERAGDFPARVQLSPGRVGWWESEITRWKLSRTPSRVSPVPGGGRRPHRSAAGKGPELTAVEPVRPPLDPTPPLSKRPSVEGQVVLTPGTSADVTGPTARPRPRRRDPRVSPDQMGFEF